MFLTVPRFAVVVVVVVFKGRSSPRRSFEIQLFLWNRKKRDRSVSFPRLFSLLFASQSSTTKDDRRKLDLKFEITKGLTEVRPISILVHERSVFGYICEYATRPFG